MILKIFNFRLLLNNLYMFVQYFDFIIYKTRADLRAEVRRFYVSYLWWILDPILNMIIFYIVFGLLMHKKQPDFVPFLLIGIVTWRWYAASVAHASMSMIQAKMILLKVNIPKIILPLVDFLADTFKFFIVFAILIIFLHVYGFSFSYSYFFLSYVFFVHAVHTICIGFVCSAIVPFLQDVKFIIDHLLHLQFFISGIFFDIKAIPEQYSIFISFNPMAVIIQSYRDILMGNHAPDILHLTYILIISVTIWAFTIQIISHYDKAYPREIS